MMTIQALILGAIQGLTEFLPISSSGHLVLIPYFFKWNYEGLSFDVALHAGTAVALLASFWKDWLSIIKNIFPSGAGGGKSSPLPFRGGGESGFDDPKRYSRNFFWQILFASIPALIVGLAIDKYAEKYLHSIIFIAFNLSFFGWLLWYADKKSRTGLEPGKITFGKAFIVGLFQSVALVPGVSRSGITITASRFIGLPREAAARFSFLLATPAIVGAFALKLPGIIETGVGPAFWLGVAGAAVFGFLAIKFLLIYLKKSDFSVFLWYRLSLAIFAVIVYFTRSC
jgi:undecaprenyl-diphosphatase